MWADIKNRKAEMTAISPQWLPVWTVMLIITLCMSGCTEEEFIPVYQVYITANPDQIGSDILISSISITALDQEQRPAPAGYQVTVFGINQSGDFSGYVGWENESLQLLSLDPSGGIQTTFSCSEQGNITLVVQLESLESAAIPITCL
jgi:hypothetical protein